MSEKERQIQELKKWCKELRNNFRNKYETLDELERSKIPNDLNYRYPCQMEFFWVAEPLEYQLFITMHDASRMDGEIIINGPFLGSELIPKVIEIMDEPRWKKKAYNEFDKTFLIFDDVGNQENKYSDIFLIPISNFIISLRNDPTSNFRKDIIHAQAFGVHGWSMIIKGNIVELKEANSLVLDSINEAKQRAARIRGKKEAELPQTNSKSEDKKYLEVFGAYYYPGIRIGDNLELTFKEKLTNTIGKPIYFPEAEYKFNFNGKHGFFDTFGFVAIQNKNEKEAVKILNTIFGVSLIFGFDSVSVREFELYSMRMDPESLSIGGFSYSEQNTKRFSPYSSHGLRKRAISLDSMNMIINIAEKVSRDETTNELVSFLLESFTHLYNFEFSQSFLFSWLVAEKHISRLFEGMLIEKKIPSKRKEKFENHNKWSTETKIEALNFAGIINSEDYDFLITYNTKRNNFAHKGKTIGQLESKELYEHSKNVVKDEINRIIK